MPFRFERHVAWRKLDDETVIIDLKNAQMYGLGLASGAVWHALAQVQNENGEPAVFEFSDDDTQIIDQWLSELVLAGLIERVDEPPRKHIFLSEALGPLLSEKPPKLAIDWAEPIEQAAASCAFLPAQNPLCTQVPFS
jgi:hypothetical protein